jgi:hypothetical protein
MGAQGGFGLMELITLAFTTFLAKELLVLSRSDLGANGNAACCAKAT